MSTPPTPGEYIWLSGDRTTLVDADPLEAVFVPPSTDPTGASGVWKRYFSGGIDIRWAGATDTSDIGDILDKLEGLCSLAEATHILIPKSSSPWKWTTAAEFTTPESIVIDGDIDLEIPIPTGSGSPTPALTFKGSESNLSNATLSADKRTIELDTDQGQHYSVGDIVRLSSSDLVDPYKTSTKSAEFGWVAAINGDFLTLQAPMRLFYVNDVKCEKVTLLQRPSVRGRGHINADPTGTTSNNKRHFARFFLCDQLEFQGLSGERTDDRFLAIEDCLGGYASGGSSRHSKESPAGYGVSVIGCTRGLKLENWRFEDLRHAVTSNNRAARGGAPSFTGHGLFVQASPLYNGSGTSPVDTHAAALEITLVDLVVDGASGSAVNIECPYCTLVRPIITGGETGISMRNNSRLDAVYKIIDATIIGPTEHGIDIRGLAEEAGKPLGDIRVEIIRPRIENPGSDGIFLLDKGGDQELTECIIEAPRITDARSGIAIDNEPSANGAYKIADALIKNCTENGIKVRIPTTTATSEGRMRLEILRSWIENAAEDSIFIEDKTNDQETLSCLIDSPVIKSPTSVTRPVVFLSGLNQVEVRNPEISGVLVYGLEIRDCTHVRVDGGVGVISTATNNVELIFLRGTTSNVVLTNLTGDGGGAGNTKGVLLENSVSNVRCETSNTWIGLTTDYALGSGAGHYCPAVRKTLQPVIDSNNAAIYPETEVVELANIATQSPTLNTINAASNYALEVGQTIRVSLLNAPTGGNTVTISNTGNIDLPASVTLTTTTEYLGFIYDGAKWRPLYS